MLELANPDLSERLFTLRNFSAAPSSSDSPKASGGGPTAPNKSDLHRQSNLTLNQLQVWLGQKLVPEIPIYHLAAALGISGEVDPDHFRKAFQTLLDSSDALRTVVDEIDGIPIQRVLANLDCQLDFVDFSVLADPQKSAKSWMEERCQTPLNLQQRLFDSALIKLAGRKFAWYLNIHHLICDGWSFELIYRYMADLYRQFQAGNAVRSTRLPAFAEYVSHERVHRASRRYQRAEAYWRGKLADDGESISFYGKSAHMVTTRTRRISHELGPDLTKRLQLMMASTFPQASVLHLLTATFVAYVHCLDGKQNYTIGIPFHNRRSRSFKETIGFFSEVLPVRIAVADDDTLASLVNKVRLEMREAVRYGQQSIANPYFKKLYEVVVNYHTGSFREFAGMPAHPEWIHNGHGDDSLALQLHDFGGSGRIVLDLDFHQAIFNDHESEQSVQHFLRVLEAFVTNPQQSLRRLNLLSPEEMQGILTDGNGNAIEFTDRRTVLEFFEQQVFLRPNHMAAVFEDKGLTYQQLNQQANRLAHYLMGRGVRRGTIVGLYIERSLEMLVGLIGILKAGAAYVAVDPRYPGDWLKTALNDARASILLTQHGRLEGLDLGDLEVIYLDSASEAFHLASQENPSSSATAEDIAYVIYTSGSTGAPKGVEIPHGALANFTQYAGQFFKIEPRDRVLQFASISFDTAIEEIFPCLTRGGTLVLRTDSMLASVSAFLEKCKEWNITVLDLPTSYWHELTAKLFSEGRVLPNEIRLVIIGGERAIPERLALWQSCVDHRVRLVNTYGPTEATVAATMCDLTDRSEAYDTQAEVSIGRPIANVRTYVLNQNLNPVPEGVPGELYIGGANLARGYLNQPELTKEKFIPNPFSKIPGSRLYRTGDLVRYRPDGDLEFLTRLDLQIKVRGFRVELQGIEAVLKGHPLVQDAAVLLDRSSTEKKLVAYLVPMEGAVLNPDEVKAYAANKLPEYMIPAALVLLDSLPLTLRGKVDRSALPPLENLRPKAEKKYEPPRTPTERQIASIWAGVLDVETISRDDPFFALGGHSLLAVQIISRIRKDFAVDIPLRAMFEAPTVAGIAALVDNATRTETNFPETLLPAKAPHANRLPLSSSQARMWFMEQLSPGSAAYNIASTIRFTGRLKKDVLKQSLTDLVRRHESLRTIFQNAGTALLQVVIPEVVLEIPEQDLRKVSATSRLQEAKRILKQEAGRPFDLEQGPLIRVLLLQLDERDHVLLLNIHHAVCDQWSMGIIAREITSFYNERSKGTDSSPYSLPVQYSDFAAWQGKWLNSTDWETQLSYWKKTLADVQPLEFPPDRTRPPVQMFHGAHDRLTLSKEMIEGLKRLSAQENATLYMAFLAAFKALMLRYCGQEDIVIGSPIAKRNRIEWEGVIGTFINIIVLRTDFSGNPTFREVLQRVRHVVLEAFSHQDIPFQKLVEELQPKRDNSRSPLVQVLFNFHNSPYGKIDLAGLSWVPFEIDQWASQFDLCVTIDTDITRKIWIAYNTDLYEPETISRLLQHYKTFIEEVLGDPEQPIRNIPVWTEIERRRVLLEWNDTKRDYPNKPVHELFEEQVEQSPDDVAIAFEGNQLTYRELNRRANQLAHYIQSLGVGPETLVGLCLERSLETVIGLLGILKAGGAYVPIDPVYPSERIRFMIEDTGMGFLLTQERLLKNLPQKESLKVILLDHLPEAPALEECENPISPSRLQNLAYVIYTSGSTGKPKGVQIEHKALVNFIHSMRQEPGINKRDVLLSVTTLAFDIAALELLLPIVVGAKVLLVSREIASDGRGLKEQLESSRATVMQGTPATWQMLLDTGWEGTQDFKILCGGEALSFDLARKLAGKGSVVWNLYGPTETTIWSTLWKVDPSYGRMSIGRPIANSQAYILDARLQPVPIGIVGDLYIGGEGLARGYLNHPELTGQKFISNPFSEDPKARLYKTGDLARYLPNGNMELIGRSDYQVKIRGFRIEPGEIEALLGRHSAVQQAIVVAREDLPGEKRLVAYVVPRPQKTLTTSELRHFLKTRLPEYMVPSAFVLLHALPLTSNGKVDRKALPLPDATSSEPGNGYVAPRNPVERQLSEIWKRLLGIQAIGVKDDFFDLGGHSLLAVRLMSHVQKAFDTSLGVSDIFRAPTIEQFAQLLPNNKLPPELSSAILVQRGGTKPPFFCVHGYNSYVQLADYLGQDQPLYGLAQHMNGKPIRYTSIEEIATHYLKEIFALQPEGPYYLGGHSIGGLVAFEIAQQLRRQGQGVALLALIDPATPNTNGSFSYNDSYLNLSLFWPALMSYLRNLASLRPQTKITSVLQQVAARAKRCLKTIVCRIFQSLGVPLPFNLQAFYVDQIVYGKLYPKATRAYVPKDYPGKVIVFKARETPYDGQSDWVRIVTGGLEIREVPGDHISILTEPNMRAWAEQLKKYLQKTHQPSSDRLA